MNEPQQRSVISNMPGNRRPECPFSRVLIVLSGLLILFLWGLPTLGQTTYDLGEINGDLRILGNEGDDQVGLPDTVMICDFNDNGMSDLFFIRGDIGSIYGSFDMEFTNANRFIDTRYWPPDFYMPYDLAAYFAYDRLLSADINGDGIEDLVASSLYSYSGGGQVQKFS